MLRLVRLAIGCFSVLGSLGPSMALAGDGVRYLRNPGVMPIVITRSGTYRLKSDLVQSDPSVDVLRIDAGDVTIDLNGFAIRGPAVCVGEGAVRVCDPSGSGSGIRVASLQRSRIRVANGVIRGLAGDGLAGEGGVWSVESVDLLDNGGSGAQIDSVDGGYLSNVTAIGNQDNGIEGFSLRLVNCDASRNAMSGISLARGLVSGCTASMNAASGVQGSVVMSGCVVMGNGGRGVEGTSAVVVNNVIAGNEDGGAVCADCSFENNVLIFNPVNQALGTAENVLSDSVIRGNAVRSSSAAGAFQVSNGLVGDTLLRAGVGTGLQVEGGSVVGYGGSVIVGASTDVAGPGDAIEVGTNLCGADTSCP